MPTIGSFTVGLGGTYATWALAFAALGSLTGPLTYTQVSPTFETASAILPGGFAYNNFLMTIQGNANAHQGNPFNRGLVIETQHDGPIFDFGNAVDDPRIIMQDLHLERKTGASVTGIYFNTNFTPFGANPKIFRRIIIGTRPGFSNQYFYGMWFDDEGFQKPATGAVLHHIFIQDVLHDGVRMGLGFSTLGLVENVTCRNCQENGFNFLRSFPAPYGTVQNCLSFFNNISDFANIGGVKGNNNASEDATAANGNWQTGAGNLSGLTIANEVHISGPKYHVNYPKLTGGLVGTGIAPLITGITRDLAWQQFPRTRVTPIGPDQTIRTIGAHQWSVLETEEVETNDTISVASKRKVSGSDIMGLPTQPDVIKGFGSRGSDRFVFTEEANVRGNYVTTGEDVMGLDDAGICPGRFVCVPEVLLLRGRTNFWYPTDTMINELTLPQPFDDDTYSLDIQVRTRHAKGGDLRFFKRNAVLHTLLMNFRIEHNVRDLAIDFLELSSSQLVRLLDWEGRLWHGVVTNTPITFASQGKSNATERLDFSLEFEGIRIN